MRNHPGGQEHEGITDIYSSRQVSPVAAMWYVDAQACSGSSPLRCRLGIVCLFAVTTAELKVNKFGSQLSY